MRRFAAAARFAPPRFSPAACAVDDLVAVLPTRPTPREAYPLCDAVEAEVVTYTAAAAAADRAEDFAAEVAHILRRGSGIVAVRGAFPRDTVDRASAAYAEILAAERAGGAAAGDHFAAAGRNSRVWNSFEKLAVHCPVTFVEYFANPVLAAVSRAWLGPHYQVTSQLNVVHPGGQPQQAHRDYHLGFMSDDEAAAWPAHAHTDVVPALTLQGAVAHVDMPLESGPTLYLPHSQKYDAGYVAFRGAAFQQHFDEHCAQVPLEKGDAIFFNPAIFHAAGENTSADVDREANLVQVSSAFGRPMESVDRGRVARAVYPTLQVARETGRLREAAWGPSQEANALTCACDGYAFPSNLDRDVPDADSIAPPSMRRVVEDVLARGGSLAELEAALDAYAVRRQTH